ncbi:uncharacterized protein LOC129000809 isoform X2 [Macrosteles quadrilineatus]|nr:uncharacterized protein LOC129000809 isoform X2 [Macrosteles quadrilineatus]
MSCLSCAGDGNRDCIPSEEFNRWTDSLHHVLHSKDGRKYFRDFLSSRGLEDSENTLEFWERCEVLCRTHTGHRGHSGSHNSRHIANLRFMKDARDLVDFAEDKINLDLAAMRVMYEAVESGNEDQIKNALKEAMQSATELLADDYQLFRKNLLEERGLGRRT